MQLERREWEMKRKKTALRCSLEGEGGRRRTLPTHALATAQHKCSVNGREREGETCTPINKVSSWGNQLPLNAAASAAKAARVGVASSVAAPSCDALATFWKVSMTRSASSFLYLLLPTTVKTCQGRPNNNLSLEH